MNINIDMVGHSHENKYNVQYYEYNVQRMSLNVGR